MVPQSGSALRWSQATATRMRVAVADDVGWWDRSPPSRLRADTACIHACVPPPPTAPPAVALMEVADVRVSPPRCPSATTRITDG